MTDKKKARLLEKLRNMIEMAERVKGNEAEAAVAAKMVESLLRKHNMTMSDVTPEQMQSGVDRATWTEMKWTHGSIPVWVNCIAIALAEAYETHCITKRATGNDSHVAKTQVHLSFVGLEIDVAATVGMFAYLYKAINRLTDEHFNALESKPKNIRSAKQSFRLGMAHSLRNRLVEIVAEKKAEYKAAGTGVAVVKQEVIDNWLVERGFQTGYNSGKRQVNSNNKHYGKGRKAGDKVSLGNQLN